MQKVAKVGDVFHCHLCDYTSFKKFNYEKHIVTEKHRGRVLGEFWESFGDTKVAKGNKMITSSQDNSDISENDNYGHKNIKKSSKMITSSHDNLDNSENDNYGHKKTDIFGQKSSKKSSNMIISCQDCNENNVSVTNILDKGEKTNKTEFSCQGCGNKYLSYNGYWKHKKKCQQVNNFIKGSNISDHNVEDENIDNNILVDKEIFMEVLKQNKEFKDLLSEQNKQNHEFQMSVMEQNKQIIELSTTKISNTITNNTNICNNKINNNFNLNVFLNETCKDAINIKEFVNSLQISFDDLERVGEEGFVEGISNIFINGLKKLDVEKRPIHCSDLKRETMYLKTENDVWEKDTDNKDRLKKVVMLIADKNQRKIFDWKHAHPDYKDSESKTNDQYLQIVIQCSGGKNDAEDDKLYEKVLKNVAKQVAISKIKDLYKNI